MLSLSVRPPDAQGCHWEEGTARVCPACPLGPRPPWLCCLSSPWGSAGFSHVPVTALALLWGSSKVKMPQEVLPGGIQLHAGLSLIFLGCCVCDLSRGS